MPNHPHSGNAAMRLFRHFCLSLTLLCAFSANAAVPAKAQPPSVASSYQPIRTNVVISWAAVSGATSYRFYEDGTQVYSGSARSATRNHSQYGRRVYTVAACNSSGCGATSYGIPVVYYTAPGGVNNLAASPTTVKVGSSASISWTIAGGSVPGVTHKVYVNGALKATTGGYSYSAPISAAGSNTIKVVACNPNNVGCGSSRSVTVTGTMDPPGKASSPTASASYQPINTNVSISWPSVATATSYKLYEGSSVIYNGSGRSTSRSNSTYGRRYYSVAACNAGGCGAKSSTIPVYFYTAPGGVNNLNAAPNSVNLGSSTLVSWTAPGGSVPGVTYNVSLNGSMVTSTSGLSATVTIGKGGSNNITLVACNPQNVGCGGSRTVTVEGTLPIPAKPVSPSLADHYQPTQTPIAVQWPANTSQISHKLYYATGLPMTSSSATIYANAVETTATPKPVHPNYGHVWYFAKACNALGGCSDFGPFIRIYAYTTPGKINNPQAPATVNLGETFTISWQAAGGIVPKGTYKITRNNVEVYRDKATQFTTSSNSYGDNNYVISACNPTFSCSSGVTVRVSIKPNKPAAPTLVSAYQPVNVPVPVQWPSNSAGISHKLFYTDGLAIDASASAIYNKAVEITTTPSPVHANYGFVWYFAKACASGNVCSDYGPLFRTVQYTAPGGVNNLNAPAKVKVGEPFTVSWTIAGGSVPGHFYKANVAGQQIYSGAEAAFETTLTTSGAHEFSVVACNPQNVGCGGSRKITVTAKTLALGGAPDTNVAALSEYEFKPQVTATPGAQLSFSVANKPAWATFDSSNGMLTGIPKIVDIGEYDNILITVNDGVDSDTLPAFKITVTDAAPLMIGVVDVKNLDIKNGHFEIHWTSNNATASYTVTPELNGSWGTPVTVSDATHLALSSKPKGRYRYKVKACVETLCSDEQISAAFEINDFVQSGNVSGAPSLAGLSNDVGFTAGQFRVNESGAANYSIALNLPAGVADVKPQVSLDYSSQGGDGLMGRGWALSAGDAITRCGQNIFLNGEISGVHYDDSDLFCYNGQQLVVDSGNYGAAGSTYHTTVDNFSLITAHGNASDSGPLYFTVVTKSGDTYYYGQTDDSDDSGDAFVEPNFASGNNGLAKYWAVKKVVDVSGNAIRYHYSEDSDKGAHTLQQIEYGKNENVAASRYFNQVTFNYVNNPKPAAGYSYGHSNVMDQLLDNITITVDGQAFRFYQLDYFTSAIIEERNYLETVTECIAKDSHCLAPLSFTWQKPPVVQTTTTTELYCEPEYGRDYCEEVTVTSVDSFTPFASEVRLSSVSDGRQFARMFDINADGYADIVFEDNGWKVMYGPNFNGTPIGLSSIGSADDVRQYALTIDYDGDGKQELLVANGVDNNWTVLSYDPHTERKRVCVRKMEECWQQTVNYTFSTIDLGQKAIGLTGAAQVMDVDGDGLQDIVFKQNSEIKMYRNNGLINGAVEFADAITLATTADEDSVGFDRDHVTHTPSMKNSATVDVDGDGRSDLLAKVTTTRQYCVNDNGHQLPLPRGEHCGDIYGGGYRVSSSSSSTYKLFVSDGTLSVPRLTERMTIGYAGSDMRVTDLNGDGLTDIVYRLDSNDSWYYQLSNGYDFSASRKMPHTSPDDAVHEIFFIDLNGDGRADILKPTSKTNWQILLSQPAARPDVILWSSRGNLARDRDDTLLFGDVNGDGKLDMVSAENDNGWFVKYADRKNIIDHVITDFTNGWGVNTHVNYDTLLNSDLVITDSDGNPMGGDDIADTFSPIGPMTVVSQASSDVTTGNSESVEYQYGGLLLHRKGLGALGFKMLRTVDNQTNIETTTSYAQQYPFTGMPLSTTQMAADGESVLSEAVNSLAQQTTANSGVFAFIDITNQTQYQIGSDGTHHTLATTVTDNDFDQWGNLTRSNVQVKDGSTLLHTTLSVNNYGSEGSWNQQMGRLLSTTVTKTPAAGAAISRTSSFTYWGANETCQNVTQARGMLKTSSINGLTTTSCYNAFGYTTKVTKSAKLNDGDTSVSNLTSYSSYSGDGRVLYQSTDTAGWVTTVQYNGASAQTQVTGPINRITSTDANSVAATRYFDVWGNVIASASAAAASVTTKTAYCSNCTTGSKYYVETQQAGSPTKRVIYDKFGREIASRVQHFSNGTYSYEFKDYDARGRLVKQYLPTTNSTRGTSAADYTQFIYDSYSRLERTELPNFDDAGYTHPTVVYAGLTTTKTDAKGNARIERKNLLGQVSEVEDASAGLLNYVYDAFGQLKTVTKKADNIELLQLTNHYNSYGQKTSMVDKDKGTWRYRYNGFGQQVWQQSGNAQQSTTVYDTAGRKVRQYAYDYTQCWIYGGAANTHAKGKLIATRYYDGDGSKACNDNNYSQANLIEYDSAGRPFHSQEQLRDLPNLLNGDYHSYSQFDGNGRLAKQHFPALGLTLRHEYQNGYPVKLINDKTGKIYQQVTEMNARGQIKNVSYANGVSEAIGYDDETGLVNAHSANKGSGNILHELSYEYEANGNLAARSHGFGALSGNVSYREDYGYDGLNRLTGRTVTTTSHASAPFNLNESYSYDGFGNFKHKQNVGYYKYQANGQLKGIYNNASFSGTPLYDFAYDSNGNVLGDGQRNFDYASFDKPVMINNGATATEFIYGMGHKRYYRHDQRSQSGKTVDTHSAYLSTLEKILRIDDSKTAVEYKITVGNLVITERSNASNNASTAEHYLHKDHLGSPLTITDKNGVIVQQNVFDPWGKVHKLYADNSGLPNALPVTTRGYTGHEGLDGLNIIHMNGRIYDPVIGRFLQADPHIQSPLDSQSFNRYAYVLNNPLSMTDPSGYFFKALGKFVKKYWRQIASIAVMFIPGVNIMVLGALSGYISTGSLKGAIIGAFTAGIAGPANTVGGFLTNGVVGGLASKAMGGNFGHGFWSAGLGALAGGSVNGIQTAVGRIVASAVVGGTISKLTGGKFANGAFGAAFARALGEAKFGSSTVKSGQEDTNHFVESDREALNADLASINAQREKLGLLSEYEAAKWLNDNAGALQDKYNAEVGANLFEVYGNGKSGVRIGEIVTSYHSNFVDIGSSAAALGYMESMGGKVADWHSHSNGSHYASWGASRDSHKSTHRSYVSSMGSSGANMSLYNPQIAWANGPITRSSFDASLSCLVGSCK